MQTYRSQLGVIWFLPLAWLWFVLVNDVSVEWTVNPQYSYGWAVPFLCLFLLWQRIRMVDDGRTTIDLRPPFSGFWLPTAVFCLLALLYAPTRLVEEANPGWRLVSWALALETVGMTLGFIHLALNPSRPSSAVSSRRPETENHASVPISPFSALVFPICFFLVAVPWPSLLEGMLIQGLTRVDTVFTTELMGWSGIPAVPHGNVIEVATGMVGIDEACSGIRSFQATLMISLFLGEFYRVSVVRRVVLCVAGFALSFLFNLARMSLLVWVAASKGVGAIASWHDPAGVTILVACFFCLWGMGAFLNDRKRQAAGGKGSKQGAGSGIANSEKPETETLKSDGGNQKPGARIPTSDFRPRFSVLRRPAIALGVWILLVEFSVEGWYRWHEVRVPMAAQWTIAWPTNKPTFKELPLTSQTRQILRYDEGRSAGWSDDGWMWQAVFLRWKPGRTAVHLAQNHTPAVCMTAAGYTLSAISPQEWFDVNGLRMPFLAYQVTNAREPYFVFYCLWDDRASAQGFKTMSLTYGNRLAPVLAGLRNPGQRSLEIAVAGPASAAEAEAAVRTELEKLITSKP